MEKILVFEDNNSRNYWFKYIIKELKNKWFLLKVYFSSKEIWINGNRIMFITLKENTNSFKAGRDDRFTRYYHFMEDRLEDNFKETLEEILLDG